MIIVLYVKCQFMIELESMGSCASSHNKNVASDSTTKLKQSFGSKMEINMAMPPPPLAAIKEKVANGDRHLGPPPSPTQSTTTSLGEYIYESKSDAFFDSQTWLESDCEDDFFSVRGELTPFGNTPLHQTFLKPTPTANLHYLDTKTLDSFPEPPSANKKKKLSELFCESMQRNQGGGDQIAPSKPIITVNEKSEFGLTFGDFFPKLRTVPRHVPRSKSVHVIRRTYGDVIKEKKGVNGHKCCLQVTLSCRSFREKRRMSHDI